MQSLSEKKTNQQQTTNTTN